MPKNPNWKYHAAKRLREQQKLRDFAAMYGPSPSPAWAFTPTGRVTFAHSPRRFGKTQAAEVWGALNDHPPPLASADYSAIEARILATMSMSRDRVRFSLQPYGSDQPTKNAFYKAFGAPFPSRPMGDIIIVVCRPSQFARFMIYRNDFGGKNSFKELAPVLFTPEQEKSEIDVSRNPAA